MSASALLLKAVALHQQGALDEAARHYRTILESDPGDADALHYLGLIAFQRGEHRTAAEQIGRAVNLAEQASGSSPAEYHVNLGNALKRCGEFNASRDAFRRAIERRPALGSAWFNLGLLQREQGDLPAAVESLSKAAQCESAPLQTWIALGECHALAGNDAEAVRSLERALNSPHLASDTAANIGRLLLELARPEPVVRLLEPLARRSADPVLLNTLGCAQAALGMLERAERTLARAVSLAPEEVACRDNLAALLKDSGRHGEAIEHYQGLLAVEGVSASVWSNYLLTLLYADGVSAEFVLSEHRRAAAALAREAEQSGPPLRHGRMNGEVIRVGYLSGDFRNHPVAFFIEGILRHHDPAAFEVHLYYNGAVTDSWTRRLQSLPVRWRNVRALSDRDLVQTIRTDRIDVLVDLSGHTAENRLPALAQRAASVQVNYLGYAFSTGLPWIDWRLVDSESDPPGSERLSSEKLWRLPGSYYAYAPPDDAPDPGESPLSANGYLSFGVASNLAKVSGASLDLWAAALRRFPGAKLHWKTRAFIDASIRRAMTEALVRRGVERRRIHLEAWSSHAGRWSFFRKVDAMLDTFPYNQATGTCEALWMGVPTVSFRGEAHPSRMGASILAAAGMPEWSFDAADFDSGSDECERRLRALCDAEALRSLRAAMRSRLQDSGLLDCRRAAGALEGAYREMLRR